MKKFNVLDRSLNLQQHFLLEASAGTGKTFSIQNIVVRLIIEEPFLKLNEILVVTFTRAATRDLKNRIRQNIEQTIQLLNYGKNGPDFLQAILEKGPEEIQQAKKRLQKALFYFDQAQIFTIHSFCARMLKQFSLHEQETELSHSNLYEIIQDFLRTEIRPDLYSPAQLEIILKHDPEQKKLFHAIQTNGELIELTSYNQLFEKFKEAMQQFDLEPQKLVADFLTQQNHFRNSKNGLSKEKTLEKIKKFSALFDKKEWNYSDFDLLIEDGLIWTDALDPSLLKSQIEFNLHYPEATTNFKFNLEPIIKEARSFPHLLTRLAKDCQSLLKRRKAEEDFFSPDDLLHKMILATEKNEFSNSIRQAYQAVIVDEFQDTDPLQWKIFKSLFLHDWKGFLYLVGDPKQSIYSFRQADIYTYLNAAEALGESSHYSLDTNYRSQTSLIDALNKLFSHRPEFIPLPKKNSFLTYQPVKAGQEKQFNFKDGLGPLHFFISETKESEMEERVFFPFISNEIYKLVKTENISFRQIAILVRDRFQAAKLSDHLYQCGIPHSNQKGSHLLDSPVYNDFIHIINAVLHPNDISAVKIALGGILIGWTQNQLVSIDSALIQFHQLRHCLFEKGFSTFFSLFLECFCKNKILDDLLQIGDLIIDDEYVGWNSPEGIITFLDRLREDPEDARVKKVIDPSKNGVQILTLHYSKGLEFDIVFALGLVNRTSQVNEIISKEFDFEEVDAEKMRQLYVAMTRAKFRLYVPLLSSEKELKSGQASPLDLFTARFENGFKDYLDKYNISYSSHQQIEKKKFDPIKEEPKHLVPPKRPSFEYKSSQVYSYSNLIKRLGHTQSISESPPHDFYTPNKTIHTFPACSETGSLMHTILEKIDFKNRSSIKEYLVDPLFKPWEEVIEQMIDNTLKTEIHLKNKSFRLEEVDPSHSFREMPFLFPYDHTLSIEDLEIKEGYIKGVIDFVFMHEGKYYFVDWKTNWLGSSQESYTKDKIYNAMKENHYFLQSSIYIEALKRYLFLFEKRPFEECFGGSIYVFLRGNNAIFSN